MDGEYGEIEDTATRATKAPAIRQRAQSTMRMKCLFYSKEIPNELPCQRIGTNVSWHEHN